MPNINVAYQWAIDKCRDPNVGYDMDRRNQQTSGGITYYDCSSFIWYALIAAGFDCVGAHTSPITGDPTWPFVTSEMPAVLQRLGFVEVPLSGEWKPGDIGVVNSPQHQHTEMVYRGGTGQGICMGAHANTYDDGTTPVPLPYQVSIGDAAGNESSVTTASFWDSLWRYGDGAGGTGYGWSLAAFCALLGNIAHEGQYNPGQIEVPYAIEAGAGIGLFQWTPDSRDYAQWGNPLINQANARGKQWTDAGFQCEMIANADQASYGSPQEWGWIGVFAPTSFSDFKQGSDVAQLTEAWVRNVERPASVSASLAQRIQTAQQWYTRLQGKDPTEGLRYSWHSVVSNERYGLLNDQEIYENVMIMFNLFCGSGGGGGGPVKKKRRGMPVWMMIRYHY